MTSLDYVKGISVKMLPFAMRQQVRKAAARGHSKEFIRLLVRHLRYGFGLSNAFARTRRKVPV
jgi:ribonuclease PH